VIFVSLFTDMNRYGNSYTSYDDNGYEYHNADGSKYAVNPDGSSVYDPGTSGKGTKWYRSPEGVKHYVDEEEDMGYLEGYETEYQNERYEYGSYAREYHSKSRIRNK
jgi:hypothetical protein